MRYPHNLRPQDVGASAGPGVRQGHESLSAIDALRATHSAMHARPGSAAHRAADPAGYAAWLDARGEIDFPEWTRPEAGGEREARGAEAPLGILRNRYAEVVAEETATSDKQREKQRSGEASKTERLADRFDLQRTAARLTPSLRVNHCIWTAVGKAVDVIKRGKDARFSGVQTCGSVWSCPVCSARISETRRKELRALEEWAGSPKLGVRMVLMTLTARHRRRALKSLVEKMAKAKARMQNLTKWKGLRADRLVGTVSVREATFGMKNGWHPHYHVLVLIRAESDEEAMELLEPLRRDWLNCLRKEGLTGTAARAFDIRPGDAVSAYISKHGRNIDDVAAAEKAREGWGISEEMTMARSKRGRGEDAEQSRSPFQILRDCHEGDVASEPVWQEYALTMHGLRQIVWSNGLKDKIGIDDKDDDQIAEGEEHTDDKDETVWSFSNEEWKRYRQYRAAILHAARTGGADAVQKLINAPHPDDGDDYDLIERPEAQLKSLPRLGALRQRLVDLVAAQNPKNLKNVDNRILGQGPP